MIIPTLYKIRIEPDLESLTFEGKVEIYMQADEPIREIVMNAVDLKFQGCFINRSSGNEKCAYRLDPQLQTATIELPEEIQGKIELSIAYSGIINDRYAGFYRSKYQHNDQEKIIASTQFEASDARRAFPCFDQPDLKAAFDIEFVIEKTSTGISNTAIQEERDLEDGKKLVRFERTPKMSTYLVFFGIGDFEFLRDDLEQPIVRVATTPGKTHFAQYALDMARKSLEFGEEYLGIPYPLTKCDYIAIPDSMGAMENFGAIRHAEDVLLVYPGITSKSHQTLITKIIAHEGIHMWFGDLVSPAAWKYLWLNEAFATYFTYVIPHYFYPEWGVWEQFFHERLLSGMERDSLASTIPIDLPNVDDPNADPAPTPSTAPIVYNKGAAIIRMLAAYIGEAVFRQALHDFLIQYQFDATSSEQFWTAIECSSGVPLQNFAETWIQQRGHPLITVAQSEGMLTLTQKRFCYAEIETDQTWVIPVNLVVYLSDDTTQTQQVIFETKSLEIDIPANTSAYKLNTEFAGFYRVSYPDENWKQLGELIKTQKLSAVDSLNVIDDFFALVKAGKHTVEAYLDFIQNYCDAENRYLTLTNLAKNLGRLYQVNITKRLRISMLGLPIFERSLDQLRWEPQDDEALVTTELRETLLWSAFNLGSERVADFVYLQYQQFVNGNSIHKDIVGTVLKISTAIHSDPHTYLWSRAIDSTQAEAGRIMALEALGNYHDQAQLMELLEKNLTEIPSSLQHYMINATVQNQTAMSFMWAWLGEHFSKIEAYPLHVVERIIVNLIPVCGLGFQDEVVEYLSEFIERHPRALDSVQMALELLAINEQLRSN